MLLAERNEHVTEGDLPLQYLFLSYAVNEHEHVHPMITRGASIVLVLDVFEKLFVIIKGCLVTLSKSLVKKVLIDFQNL